MVIDDFDVFGAAVRPSEADSPLVVDANAVLSLPVSPQGLQPVSRRNPQIAEAAGNLELAELSARDCRAALEPPDPASTCERCGVCASE
jgi:hypothetical protein